MSADDDLRTGLRSLLDNLDSPVTLPKRDRRETTMHMAMRYDPAFNPTASTLRGRERQAGKRLVEIFKEREAMMTSPPSPASDEEEITADGWLDSSQST